jgi:catechol 2,3-dioxygenase-like lactoylglutathione lyase family enzyme
MTLELSVVSHVAIGVHDMESSLLFYRDLLGMTVAGDKVEASHLSGRRRAVFLQWGDPAGSFIVLDESLDKERVGTPPDLFEIGVHHFGFWGTNVEGLIEKIKGSPYEIVYESEIGNGTQMFGEDPNSEIKSLIVKDPDGNCVQIDERLG